LQLDKGGLSKLGVKNEGGARWELQNLSKGMGGASRSYSSKEGRGGLGGGWGERPEFKEGGVSVSGEMCRWIQKSSLPQQEVREGTESDDISSWGASVSKTMEVEKEGHLPWNWARLQQRSSTRVRGGGKTGQEASAAGAISQRKKGGATITGADRKSGGGCHFGWYIAKKSIVTSNLFNPKEQFSVGFRYHKKGGGGGAPLHQSPIYEKVASRGRTAGLHSTISGRFTYSANLKKKGRGVLATEKKKKKRKKKKRKKKKETIGGWGTRCVTPRNLHEGISGGR